MQEKKTRYSVLGWKDPVEIDYSRTVSIKPEKITSETVELLEKKIQYEIKDMLSGKTSSNSLLSGFPDNEESKYLII